MEGVLVAVQDLQQFVSGRGYGRAVGFEYAIAERTPGDGSLEESEHVVVCELGVASLQGLSESPGIRLLQGRFQLLELGSVHDVRTCVVPADVDEGLEDGGRDDVLLSQDRERCADECVCEGLEVFRLADAVMCVVACRLPGPNGVVQGGRFYAEALGCGADELDGTFALQRALGDAQGGGDEPDHHAVRLDVR